MILRYTFILGLSWAVATNSSASFHHPTLSSNSDLSLRLSTTSEVAVGSATSTGRDTISNANVVTINSQSTFVTYCPSVATFAWDGSKTTVYGPSTVTFSDCPCTISKLEGTSSETGSGSSLEGSIDTTGSASGQVATGNATASRQTGGDISPSQTGSESGGFGGGNSGQAYTTEVVQSYTTYCPSPTTFAQGSHTYTVTGPTTLTITDCPCTITRSEPSSLGSEASGGGNSGQGYTTEVVQSYTTYCPSSTTVVQGSHTYTATGPTTLTITDCPCTITRSKNPTVGYGTETRPLTGQTGRTSVVSSFTTYIPSPTTLTFNSKTYTVSGATMLTVTDCPCTLTGKNGTSPGSEPNSLRTEASGLQSANWAGQLQAPVNILLAGAGFLAL